jgi:hypothetical protein
MEPTNNQTGQPGTDKPKIDLYNPAQNSQELQDLLKSQNEPKEKFETRPPDSPNSPSLQTGDKDKEIPTGNENQKPVRDPAKVGKAYFTLTDKPMRLVAGWLADESMGNFKLPKDDQDELIEAWTEIAEDHGWKKPPAWMTILIIIICGYGFMIWHANQIRIQKKKKAAEELQNKLEGKTQPEDSGESDKETAFSRQCPNCKKPVFYKTEKHLLDAITKNAECKKCIEKADKKK